MKYVLAGSSGFLGKALASDLVADGHQVTRLVRRQPTRPDELRWDPARGELDLAAVEDADVMVNLAGANIGRPWTPTYKSVVRESRVSTTATLAAAAAQLDRRPVLITQSGIGGYGKDCGDRILTEDAELSGPVNVVLPTPVTNKEFTQALASALHRPALVPVPSFVLTTLLGEFAWELIGSNRALPTKLLATGFSFAYPTAQTALASALHTR